MTTVLDQQIEELQAAEAKAQADACEAARLEYLDIVRRRNNPHPNDARDLLRALAASGVTIERHAANQEALAEVERLSQSLRRPADIRKIRDEADAAKLEERAEFAERLRAWFLTIPPDQVTEKIEAISRAMPAGTDREAATAAVGRIRGLGDSAEGQERQSLNAECLIARLRDGKRELFGMRLEGDRWIGPPLEYPAEGGSS